jgi:FkbM family methyltransferase
VLATISFILRHPLNRSRPLAALSRYAGWQIGSRLARRPIVVPFAGRSKLIARAGMAGATGNIYCGLHEFEEMGFVAHLLRPGDLFADVGANIGSYTVLAAEAGADCIAFEPVSAAYATLSDNISINGLAGRVTAIRAGVGRKAGTLSFVTGEDTTNRVATGRENGVTAEVQVVTLDEALPRTPVAIKVDVEGFESEVVAGAARTLGDQALLAVVMELNGSGERYGFSDADIRDRMAELDFQPCDYDPLSRNLSPRSSAPATQNTIFVRKLDEVRTRLMTAPLLNINGVRF